MKKTYEELEEELEAAKKVTANLLKDFEKYIAEIGMLKTENVELRNKLRTERWEWETERLEWEAVRGDVRDELGAIDGAVVVEVRSLSDVLALEERLDLPCDVTDVGWLLEKL